MLVETGLLAAIAPEVPGRITDTFWQSLAGDRQPSARRSSAIPKSLGNAILLGSLLIPLGLLDQHHGRTKELGARFGILPLARRDVEFLRQILMLQRHLRDVNASPRHKRAIMHRSGLPCRAHVARAPRQRPALVESWRALQAEAVDAVARDGTDDDAAAAAEAPTPQTPPAATAADDPTTESRARQFPIGSPELTS